MRKQHISLREIEEAAKDIYNDNLDDLFSQKSLVPRVKRSDISRDDVRDFVGSRKTQSKKSKRKHRNKP
jgi:hypothetical protein